MRSTTPTPNNSPVELGKKLAKVSRPSSILYSSILVALSAVYTGTTTPLVVLYCLLVFQLYVLATMYNNFYDQRTDGINNNTQNLLVTRELSPRQVTIFTACICTSTVVTLIAIGSYSGLVVTIAYVALLIMYSHPIAALQSRGLVAPLSLAVCYGVLPLLLPATGLYDKNIWLACGLQMILLSPVLLAKDYKDEKGDSLVGKKTFLVRHGAAFTMKTAVIWASAGLAIIAAVVLLLGQSLFVMVFLVPYWLLVYRIHAQQGRLNKWAKKLLFLMLIGATVSVIYL